MAIPPLGFLKYRGSTGTGLAQPKPTTTIIKRPKGSRWRRGVQGEAVVAFGGGVPNQ